MSDLVEPTDCGILDRHEHEWTRGEERAVVMVQSGGVVTISEALLDRLLTEAGWMRGDPELPPPVPPTDEQVEYAEATTRHEENHQ